MRRALLKRNKQLVKNAGRKYKRAGVFYIAKWKR